jgi:hypothetical protein
MQKILCRLALGLLALPILASFWTSPAHAASPYERYSTIVTNKTEVKADGIDNATISVTIKNDNLLGLKGIRVHLVSSRGTLDEIVQNDLLTDSSGKARFLVRSLRNGTSTFHSIADGYPLPKSVNITFQAGLSFPLTPGALIKIPDDGNASTLSDTAVYYFANNGKRYVFPHEKVYFTWYQDFSPVQILPIDQMSLIPIGGNVTYHPGTNLVKFQTDTKTYIVTRGGVLRWVKTEDIARAWFGDQWNQHVHDISEAFYINYTFGEPVNNALDLALEQIRLGTRTIDQDKGL